jgi:hypothetical protein
MTDLATVKVTPLTERIGQVMTTELQDGFNPSGVKVPPHYVLSVVLTRTRADLLIRTDGTASRTQYTVSATYTLRRVTDNAAVLTGSSRLVSGIDVNDNNNYSNIVAGNEAELRLVRDLSDQIRGRVAIYLRQQSESAAAKP